MNNSIEDKKQDVITEGTELLKCMDGVVTDAISAINSADATYAATIHAADTADAFIDVVDAAHASIHTIAANNSDASNNPAFINVVAVAADAAYKSVEAAFDAAEAAALSASNVVFDVEILHLKVKDIYERTSKLLAELEKNERQ